MAVVDPGVGTERRAIAAQIGDQFYVAPDNGLLTPILKNAEKSGKLIEIVKLNQSEYWLPNPSKSFHGRDIFATVGTHLANGLPLDRLGEEINDPLMLVFPKPIQSQSNWLGEITLVDVFGNLSTNILEEMLGENTENLIIHIEGERIHGLTNTFDHARPGELISTIDSSGTLAISVVNGNAARRLGGDMDTPVEIIKPTMEED